MEKIRMDTPLVEMDGDEMTRVIWAMIKDILLKPFVDLKRNTTISVCLRARRAATRSLTRRRWRSSASGSVSSARRSPPTPSV